MYFKVRLVLSLGAEHYIYLVPGDLSLDSLKHTYHLAVLMLNHDYQGPLASDMLAHIPDAYIGLAHGADVLLHPGLLAEFCPVAACISRCTFRSGVVTHRIPAAHNKVAALEAV